MNCSPTSSAVVEIEEGIEDPGDRIGKGDWRAEGGKRLKKQKRKESDLDKEDFKAFLYYNNPGVKCKSVKGWPWEGVLVGGER